MSTAFFLEYAQPLLVPVGLLLIGTACKQAKIDWKVGSVGIVAVGLFVYLIARDSATSDFGILLGIIKSAVAMVGGLIAFVAFVFYLSNRRKVIAVVVVFLLPILFAAGLKVGNQFAPERRIESDTAALVTALEKFRIEQSAYPQTLQELVPQYMTALPDSPESNYGWLYKQTNDHYALGYACWIDRYFVDFCVYDKDTKRIQMNVSDPPNTPIFVVGPTPSH